MVERDTKLGEIEQLVEALCDQHVSSEQLDRLNQLLEHDAQARRHFVEVMSIEAELSRVLCPSSAGCEPDSPQPITPVPSAASLGGRFRRIILPLATLAATITTCIVGSSWLTYEGVRGRGPLAQLFASAERIDLIVGAEDNVANVAATRNCQWGGDAADHLSLGSAVASNQLLQLKTGVAELNFVNGARLILEGPASFQVKDANTVYLYNGRVAASLPASAERFTLSTPKMTVRKSASSTQYGVVAGGDGSDQVHVFEGALEAQAVDRGGRVANELRLGSLEAAAIEPTKNAFSRLDLDNDGFVRSIELRNGPGKGLLAFDDFSYPAGPLALQNGGFGWAGPWTVLETENDGNQESNGPGGVAVGSLATSGVVALGNRFYQSDNFNRMRRVVSTSRGGVFDVAGCIEVIDAFPLVRRTGKSIYMSFLQRVSNPDGTFYGFELHRGDGRYNRVLHIGTGVDGNGYGASVSFEQPAGQAKFVSLGEENNEVNFIVIRIDYGEKEKDSITIYRNPGSIDDESRCIADAQMEGNFGFDRVSIGNYFGNKVHEIDEIRVGTDFQAVTGSISTSGIRGLSDFDLRSHRWKLLANADVRSGATKVELRSTSKLLIR